MVAVLGEFLGTTTFLFFAFAGAQNGSIGEAAPDSQSLIYVSLSFGLSLLINAWIFYRISGGLFNPAVSSPLRNLENNHLTVLGDHCTYAH